MHMQSALVRDGETLRTSDPKRWQPVGIGFESVDSRHPFEDSGQRNGGHPAPDACAETVVWSDRKRQVSVSIVVDIEAVGVGEVSLVTVHGSSVPSLTSLTVKNRGRPTS